MKYVFAIVAAPVAIIAALFYGDAQASASPTDTGVTNNPGLQQACAFNPAFNKAHAKACEGVSVESAASNGGNASHDDDGDGTPNGEDPTPLG